MFAAVITWPTPTRSANCTCTCKWCALPRLAHHFDQRMHSPQTMHPFSFTPRSADIDATHTHTHTRTLYRSPKHRDRETDRDIERERERLCHTLAHSDALHAHIDDDRHHRWPSTQQRNQCWFDRLQFYSTTSAFSLRPALSAQQRPRSNDVQLPVSIIISTVRKRIACPPTVTINGAHVNVYAPSNSHSSAQTTPTNSPHTMLLTATPHHLPARATTNPQPGPSILSDHVKMNSTNKPEQQLSARAYTSQAHFFTLVFTLSPRSTKKEFAECTRIIQQKDWQNSISNMKLTAGRKTFCWMSTTIQQKVSPNFICNTKLTAGKKLFAECLGGLGSFPTLTS